jgi:hypothetical protein
MADSTQNKENIPPEDVWAAARRRLQENQVWIRLPNTTPNPNVWKEALEFHKKKK